MTKTTEQLYAELKDDVATVANALFDLSERLLRENGNFLPHGFVLNDEGKDTLVGAIGDNGSGMSTSTTTLPLLHEGLRKQAESGRVRAIGVAENVTITPTGGSTTKAIKVLFEHREGLCVALYLPFKKKLFGGYETGTPFTVPAAPEVKAWHAGEA
jgi:hypothetical protein